MNDAHRQPVPPRDLTGRVPRGADEPPSVSLARETFWGRGAFAGDTLDPGTRARSPAGQSLFRGCIVFTNWPRDDVMRLLPDELELAAATAAGSAALHPVAFVFGEQSEGSVVFARVTVPMGIAYREFGMVIPFVKHQRGRYLHAFVPRMYSSYFPVVWDGNVRYGFGKDVARMEWQGSMFVMTTEARTLLFHAAVDPAPVWSPGATCGLPNFDAMREVFALPMLGRRADGAYVCSSFRWTFDQALVGGGDAWISIDAPLLPGLVPRRFHAARAGTFEVRGMQWRLSWPGACRC